MANVCRESQDRAVDVYALPVPCEQSTTDKCMSQILKAWGGMLSTRLLAELATQPVEGVIDGA